MKQFILLTAAVCAAIAANAKIWRVNNNAGVTADFTDMPACIASASVLNDDTIHVEASAVGYTNFILNKRLVIIGTGYFLSGANSNPGLQANPNPATLDYFFVDTLASGSQFIGLNLSNGIYTPTSNAPGADNVTITRCRMSNLYIGYSNPAAGADYIGWIINKCYIANFTASARPVKNAAITNSIITGVSDLSNVGNLNNLVRNNVFRSTVNINNTYFSNNIIAAGFNAINSTVKNNTCINTAPAGFATFVGVNGNVAGQLDVNIFQGLTGNSTDGQWQLKAGSQAIGTGETVNSITPDRGAFGTADPYILSGIPPVPTIYSLTVPASVPSNATTMPITISTKSNN